MSAHPETRLKNQIVNTLDSLKELPPEEREKRTEHLKQSAYAFQDLVWQLKRKVQEIETTMTSELEAQKARADKAENERTIAISTARVLSVLVEEMRTETEWVTD